LGGGEGGGAKVGRSRKNVEPREPRDMIFIATCDGCSIKGGKATTRSPVAPTGRATQFDCSSNPKEAKLAEQAHAKRLAVSGRRRPLISRELVQHPVKALTGGGLNRRVGANTIIGHGRACQRKKRGRNRRGRSPGLLHPDIQGPRLDKKNIAAMSIQKDHSGG